MTTDFVTDILLPALAGMGISLFHFGLLWWTVKRLAAMKRLDWWFPVSFLVRNGISITAFFFATGGDWRRVVACVAGFLVVRRLMVRRIGNPTGPVTGTVSPEL